MPRLVRGDRRKLRQVLLNLIGNAVKFTEAGGLNVTVTAQGGTVHFVVTDTGIGISDVTLKKIFDPFTRAKQALSLDGTGLGLSISDRFVEVMGGTLTVQSKVAQGSKFTLTLPLPAVRERPPESTELAGAQPDLEPSRQGRILVVDDDPINRRIVTAVLRSGGHQTEEAEDGRQALEQFASFQPDLILMDVRMPVMDGLEATRQLREIPKFADLPIIALTASTGSDAETRQIRAGFTEHLAKPIQASELFAALATHLN